MKQRFKFSKKNIRCMDCGGQVNSRNFVEVVFQTCDNCFNNMKMHSGDKMEVKNIGNKTI